jgi:hypothetical protein
MRQNFLGVVVGTAMQKTVKVRVMTQKVHPIVRKVTTRSLLSIRKLAYRKGLLIALLSLMLKCRTTAPFKPEPPTWSAETAGN